MRLIMSYGELALGLSAQRKPEPGEVYRLVFVCHGNICHHSGLDLHGNGLFHTGCIAEPNHFDFRY